MSTNEEKEFEREVHLWQKGVQEELDKKQVPKELDQFVSNLLLEKSSSISKKALFTGIAAILIASFVMPIIYLSLSKHAESHSAIQFKGDMNQDSEINMVDAFLLYKKLNNDKNFKGDLNGDGVTDQADVNWLAVTSVKVGLL